MRITNDWRRTYARLLLDANPTHPMHWGSGNAATLRDAPRAAGVDVHAALLEFYADKYSANHMALCVLGKQSLPALEALVVARFSAVRNTGLRVPLGDTLNQEVGKGQVG